MAYSEYSKVSGRTYSNSYTYCVQSYYDYSNSCSHSYRDYSDCETYSSCSDSYYNTSYYVPNYGSSNCSDYHSESINYSDYRDCETSYSNSYSCSVSYNNYANDCSTYTNYGNTLPSKAGAINLTWSTSNWSGDTLIKEKVTDSKAALQELRDNIRYLSQNKGTNTVSDANISSASGSTANSTFDDANSTTIEKPIPAQFNSMRDALESLFSQLISSSTGISQVSTGGFLQKTSIESLKKKADTLASTTAYYSNVVAAHVDYSETKTG